MLRFWLQDVLVTQQGIIAVVIYVLLIRLGDGKLQLRLLPDTPTNTL